MDNLKGKTAFITGGASGIGLALAVACCEEGMNVVVADIRQSAIDDAMAVLSNEAWPVMTALLDVTDRDAYKKVVDEAEAKFGNIHLLINNAGIGASRGPLWDVTYAQTDLAIDINLTAVLTGIQLVVPHMLKHGEGGYIVNTASKAALIAVPNCGLYNLTKQALISLSETLAMDLSGTSVGACVFCPGPFQTSLGQTSGEIEALFLGDGASTPPPPRPGVNVQDFAKVQRPAAEAAKRVLQGVKNGDLYIFTHSEFKNGFGERVDAMLRAFPDEIPNEEFKKVFSFLVHNPVFETQRQVPAFES